VQSNGPAKQWSFENRPSEAMPPQLTQSPQPPIRSTTKTATAALSMAIDEGHVVLR
jgi:hypothetical protein